MGPAVVGVRAAVASFVDNTVTATSTFGAAPDWVAPQVVSTTLAKVTGYLAGSVKQGGQYYVYANATDTGSPASGIAVGGERADVSAVTPAGTAVTLVAGSYSVGGVSYSHRSAQLTAANPLAAGSYTYSVNSADVAGNSRVQTGYGVIVDNTAPAATNVQTTNAGTLSKAEPGDTIVFTYTEQIDPQSVLAGWTGPSTSVVVRLIDGGCLLSVLVKICSDDSVAVYNAANSSALPLGTIDLQRDDYHGGGIIGTQVPLAFGATGTPSTMVQSGSTITITLGTGTGADTAGGAATMTWSPSATPYDAAGNPASTTAVNEGGTSDRDF